jgi:hypothetical protein
VSVMSFSHFFVLTQRQFLLFIHSQDGCTLKTGDHSLLSKV